MSVALVVCALVWRERLRDGWYTLQWKTGYLCYDTCLDRGGSRHDEAGRGDWTRTSSLMAKR